MKCINKVSMKITMEDIPLVEQTIKELKPFGFEYIDSYSLKDNIIKNWDLFSTYYNTIGENNLGCIATKQNTHTYIDKFNKDLFIALATMTNSREWMIGDWLMHKKEKFVFKCMGLTANHPARGFANSPQLYRKATVEELITHFTNKEFILPEKWAVGITDNNRDIIKKLRRQSTYGYKFYFSDNAVGDKLVYKKNKFTLITNDQFNKYILTKKEMSYTIKPEQANEIINIACSNWKEKLANKWATNIILEKDITITTAFYNEMRNACTTEQNELFDTIFKNFKENDWVVWSGNTPCIAQIDKTNLNFDDCYSLKNGNSRNHNSCYTSNLRLATKEEIDSVQIKKGDIVYFDYDNISEINRTELWHKPALLKVDSVSNNRLFFSSSECIKVFEYNTKSAISNEKICFRKATEEEINEYNSIPEGTPCLVRTNLSQWALRYADGKGRFYELGKKYSIYVSIWEDVLPLPKGFNIPE